MDFDLSALLPFIAVGFAAQAVDGALGMAFGVISNTLLVGVLGVPPALASQRVHVVECFTTATSGISHLLHGNIDKKLFFRLLIPGMIGGATGAYVLTSLDAAVVKPFVLAYLTAIGLMLLYRGFKYPPAGKPAKVVAPLGLVGGFLDAAGGGGWGPTVTTTLVGAGIPPPTSVAPTDGTPGAVARLATATGTTGTGPVAWEFNSWEQRWATRRAACRSASNLTYIATEMASTITTKIIAMMVLPRASTKPGQ